MKYLIIFVIIFSFASLCNAQVAVPETESKEMGASVYGIGLSSGVASGFGLSFRHHLPSNLSYQLIGGVIKVDEDVSYNLGGELHFDFTRGVSTRFFGAGTMGYFYQGDSSNELTAPFRLGLGIGGEFRIAEALHFNAELLFTYFTNGDILPLPQASIHYYFF
ncbi:MAG: hypothetical protein QME52_00685 [Bacteroidota bacterium]|nr:hypothetical protein [Bacteroidota bacterium]